MGRKIGGTVLGIFVGLVVLLLAQAVRWFAYRIPVRVGMTTREVATLIGNSPTGALLITIVGWGLAALAGAYMAAKVGRDRRVVLIVLALLAGAALLDASFAWWVRAGGAIAVLLGGALAYAISKPSAQVTHEQAQSIV